MRNATVPFSHLLAPPAARQECCVIEMNIHRGRVCCCKKTLAVSKCLLRGRFIHADALMIGFVANLESVAIEDLSEKRPRD